MDTFQRLAVLRAAIVMSSGCVLLTGAFLAGRASARSVPSAGALPYAGARSDARGVPLGESPQVEVRIWGAAQAGERPLCSTSLQTPLPRGGKPAIDLHETCSEVLKDREDTWAEVLVDGATLGRSKLQAMPSALEAGHATASD